MIVPCPSWDVPLMIKNILSPAERGSACGGRWGTINSIIFTSFSVNAGPVSTFIVTVILSSARLVERNEIRSRTPHTPT